MLCTSLPWIFSFSWFAVAKGSMNHLALAWGGRAGSLELLHVLWDRSPLQLHAIWKQMSAEKNTNHSTAKDAMVGRGTT